MFNNVDVQNCIPPKYSAQVMASNGEEQDSMYAFEESTEDQESYDIGETSNQTEGGEGDVTTDEISMDDPVNFQN